MKIAVFEIRLRKKITSKRNAPKPKQMWGQAPKDGLFRGGVTRFEAAKQTGS